MHLLESLAPGAQITFHISTLIAAQVKPSMSWFTRITSSVDSLARVGDVVVTALFPPCIIEAVATFFSPSAAEWK